MRGTDGRLLRPGRSSWGDEASRASLEMLADSLGHSTGFGLAVVSLVDDQGMCENVAVAGTEEARAQLLGTRVPLDRLMRELEEALVLGRMRYLRAEDNRIHDAWGWHADLPAPDDDTSWHPIDWLVAVVRDHEGEVVGLLQLDEPLDGRRPDHDRLALVDRRCAVAVDAVVRTRERERLAASARLALAARNVVRHSSGRQSIPSMLTRCHEAVLEGFRARAVFIQLLDEHGSGGGKVYTRDGEEAVVPPALIDLAERDAPIGWELQQVAIVDREHPTGSWLSMGEGGYLLAFLDRLGLESILFAPIGVAGTCLGSLTLTRAPGDGAWTHAELETALDVGHDLGHAVLNARAHHQEQRMLSELRELDTYKSALIATVSHEMRNPLSAVTGHLELLASQDEELPEGVGRSLAAMTRGARRLEQIVEDLLVYSKVGDPSRVFSPAEIDLRTVVRDACELHELTAAEHQQQVVLDLPDEPVRVRGVPRDLECVVSNLVGNALKYSPAGAAVTLALSQGQREVVLRCVDRGLGISAADQAEIFGEFFRSADPDVRRQGGTGLGLAIVTRIVRRHRGHVRVRSMLGGGSTFEVLLPSAEELDRMTAEAALEAELLAASDEDEDAPRAGG